MVVDVQHHQYEYWCQLIKNHNRSRIGVRRSRRRKGEEKAKAIVRSHAAKRANGLHKGKIKEHRREQRITYDAQTNFLLAHSANFHARGHIREDRRYRERDTVKEIKQKPKTKKQEEISRREGKERDVPPGVVEGGLGDPRSGEGGE